MAIKNARFLTTFLSTASNILLRKSLLAFSLLFLLITSAYGKQCHPEIWASDCYVFANRDKTSLYIYVECSKKTSRTTLQISSTGFPQKNGDLPEIEKEETKYNMKFGVFSFNNLKINTKYNYVLKVWDDSSCESFAAGGLGTAQRNFTLYFENIHVYDDGDDGIAGNGELELYVWVGENLKPGPKKLIRFGSQHDSWAESGKSYIVNKSRKLTNINNPSIEIEMKAIENDTSGSWFDPQGAAKHTEESYSDRIIDLNEWEQNNKYHDEWSSMLLGSPTVGLMFKGLLEFEKGDYGHTTYPDIQSSKPQVAAQPESMDDIKKLIFEPPPPEIKQPLQQTYYLNVPVDIQGVKGPVWNPVEALEVDFQYKQVDQSSEKKLVHWIPKTMIYAYGTWPDDTINHHTFNSTSLEFTPKGDWRVRARAIPQKEDPSIWSQWRYFRVKTIDSEWSKKISLQPIVIKSPKVPKKWAWGSKMKIRWLATGVTKRMKITLWKNGVLVGTIADNIIPPPPKPQPQPKEMAYNWRVGDKIKNITTGKKYYRIKIEEKGKFSARSDPFEIVQVGGRTKPAEQRQVKALLKPTKERQIKAHPIPLRVISPRNNQSFNFRSDVVIKTIHDSGYPIKYELKSGNAGRFHGVKLSGGALKGLGSGKYSLRISYEGRAPGKVVNFRIKNLGVRTKTKPKTKRHAQPQTRAD